MGGIPRRGLPDKILKRPEVTASRVVGVERESNPILFDIRSQFKLRILNLLMCRPSSFSYLAEVLFKSPSLASSITGYEGSCPHFKVQRVHPPTLKYKEYTPPPHSKVQKVHPPPSSVKIKLLIWAHINTSICWIRICSFILLNYVPTSFPIPEIYFGH